MFFFSIDDEEGEAELIGHFGSLSNGNVMNVKHQNAVRVHIKYMYCLLLRR